MEVVQAYKRTVVPKTQFFTSGASGASTDNAQGNITWDVSDVKYLNFAVYLPVLGAGATSVTVSVDTQLPDGLWYHLFTSSALTALGGTRAVIGPGCGTNQLVGTTIRAAWTVAGSPTAPSTVQVSCIGEN